MDSRIFQKIRETRLPGESWEIVAKSALNIGFELAWLKEINLSKPESVSLDYIKGPIDWPRHYRSKDYSAIDPVIEYPRTHNACTTWHQLSETTQNVVAKRMYMEANAFGLEDALVIVFETGIRGTLSVATYAGSKILIESADDRMKEFLIAMSLISMSIEAKHSCVNHSIVNLQDLTPKELQVLKTLPLSHSNAHLAYLVGVQESTVEKHLSNIRKKMGIFGKHQLAEVGRTII
jgi:DNA-binding CsgD family transcriptional regulator